MEVAYAKRANGGYWAYVSKDAHSRTYTFIVESHSIATGKVGNVAYWEARYPIIGTKTTGNTRKEAVELLLAEVVAQRERDMNTEKLQLGDIVKFTTGVGFSSGTSMGVVVVLSPQGNRVAVEVAGSDRPPIVFNRHSDGAYRMMNSTHYVRLYRATAAELEAHNAHTS